MPSYVHTACGCVRKGVCNTATVANYVQAFVRALQILVYRHFHIVELDFNTVQKGVLVCRTGRDFIERINHFDNPVQDAFGSTKLKSPGVAFNVGTVKDSSILAAVLRLPLIRSPKRCTITPPPSILLRRAMDSP